jgi:hypothetical protein
MYGLDKNVDLSFLKDCELIQLCVGLYQIVFKFDEDVAISVEGEFHYFNGQNESIWRPEPGASVLAAHTATLLGSRIENFESDANGSLALTFSNGHRLILIDSSKDYQSYDITRPGQTIVV